MFVFVLCAFILCLPHVEAGKNTSTVIPASRKRRKKGNPLVSGETVPTDLSHNQARKQRRTGTHEKQRDERA
jgi:hypothetical protein